MHPEARVTCLIHDHQDLYQLHFRFHFFMLQKQQDFHLLLLLQPQQLQQHLMVVDYLLVLETDFHQGFPTMLEE